MFILGCHRSGTSMLAGLTRQLISNLASVASAEDELVGGNAENPEGFFESHLLVQTSNELLDLVNASWDRPFLAKPVWKNSQLIQSLTPLREQFSDYWHEPWIDKDPRLCLLWDAYTHILLRQPLGMAIVRNPLQVATSLQLRNGFSYNKGAIIWWLYNYHLITSAPESQLLIICDANLLRAEHRCVAEMAHFLSRHRVLPEHISEERLQDELGGVIQRFCKPRLRRAIPVEPEPCGLLKRAFQHWQRWQESECSVAVWREGFETLPSELLELYEEELGQGLHGSLPLLTHGFSQRCGVTLCPPPPLEETRNQLTAVADMTHIIADRLKDIDNRLLILSENLPAECQPEPSEEVQTVLDPLQKEEPVPELPNQPHPVPDPLQQEEPVQRFEPVWISPMATLFKSKPLRLLLWLKKHVKTFVHN